MQIATHPVFRRVQVLQSNALEHQVVSIDRREQTDGLLIGKIDLQKANTPEIKEDRKPRWSYC